MPDFLPDFRDEFEAAALAHLRRRFLGYCAIFGALALVVVALILSVPVEGRADGPRYELRLMRAALIASVAQAALFISTFVWVLTRGQRTARQQLLRLVFWLIVASCLVQLIPAPVLAQAITGMAKHARFIGPNANLGPMLPLIVQTLLIHLSAALLIPWTAREAVRPMAAVLGLYALITLIAPLLSKRDSMSDSLIIIPLLAIVALPGVGVAWYRHSRFRRSFENTAVRARYGQIVGELADAKRIHERLFPEPIQGRPVSFDFAYEPMRLIGGDFLYIRRHAGDALSLVLIDVTGHGISAALTVNRLHGELNRIYGRDPDAPPGAVLVELNRYVGATLATDSLFATAVCIHIDPARETLRWASAGHPPAILRRADGSTLRLGATVFLLGAVGDDGFDAAEEAIPFRAGDAVLAYTDGAIETHNAEGRALGIGGLGWLAAVAPGAPAGWAATVLRAVRNYRAGPAQDDTLLVQLHRA